MVFSIHWNHVIVWLLFSFKVVYLWILWWIEQIKPFHITSVSIHIFKILHEVIILVPIMYLWPRLLNTQHFIWGLMALHQPLKCTCTTCIYLILFNWRVRCVYLIASKININMHHKWLCFNILILSMSECNKYFKVNLPVSIKYLWNIYFKISCNICIWEHLAHLQIIWECL